MKKVLLTIMVLVAAFGLVACGSTDEGKNEETATKVTVATLNGNKEETKVDVPYNPERIAILDLAALDIIDNLGVGDRVVGTADTSIDYLKKYADNKDIKNLGTIKEVDIEAVMESEPDVIFIGGRLAASYDDLSEIAPVVYLSTDTEIGVVESVRKNAKTIASMFGLEDEVDAKMEGFTKRIENLKEIGEGKTAHVGLVTSGSFNLLGNNGRCSLIGNEIGFNNLTGDTEESEGGGGGRPSGAGASSGGGSSHGNEASFELVVKQNPEYIFVLDRDSAIGTEGAKLAQDVMDNELIKSTNAYKEDKIVYLENPAIWYTAEGGITALDVMISDIESALE